jgi:hypothetical protein
MEHESPLHQPSPWERRVSDAVSKSLQSQGVRESEHFAMLDYDTLLLVYTSLRDAFTMPEDALVARATDMDTRKDPIYRAVRKRYGTLLLEAYEQDRVRLMRESGRDADSAALTATVILRGGLAQREYGVRFVEEHAQLGRLLPHLLRSDLYHHGAMTVIKALSEISYDLYEG